MANHAGNPIRVPIEDAISQIRRSVTFKRQLMEGDAADLDLTQPMFDAIGLFEELGIRYALIGGLASMIYGTPRHTLDVDFVAPADHERLLAARPDVMRRHRFDPTCTWKLYHDSGVDIDIWKDAHVDEIVDRAIVSDFHGRPVHVAEPHDLIAMKLRADRPQDDYDISEILKHLPIDDAVIASRVTVEQLERYRSIQRRTLGSAKP